MQINNTLLSLTIKDYFHLLFFLPYHPSLYPYVDVTKNNTFWYTLQHIRESKYLLLGSLEGFFGSLEIIFTISPTGVQGFHSILHGRICNNL